MNREQTITLSATYVTVLFGAIILLLAIAHLATQSVKYHLGLPAVYGLVALFDMGIEANLPTFFSVVQLLLVCLVLAAIGVIKRQAGDTFARHWLVLALIFLLLATDELAEIHEQTIRPIRELVPGLVTGLFYWAWVVPAALLVVLVSVAYARFVFAYLPPDLRRSTLLGATIFVGGAIGIEMPEARYVERYGLENFTYALFVLAEETMEMTGVLIFLSGLLNYLARDMAAVTVQMVPAGLYPATEIPAQRATANTTKKVLALREGAQE